MTFVSKNEQYFRQFKMLVFQRMSLEWNLESMLSHFMSYTNLLHDVSHFAIETHAQHGIYFALPQGLFI